MDRIDLLKENQDLKKELEKHKKALDKACKRFAEIHEDGGMCEYTYCPLENDNDYCDEQCGMVECWKEWCLKDE